MTKLPKQSLLFVSVFVTVSSISWAVTKKHCSEFLNLVTSHQEYLEYLSPEFFAMRRRVTRDQRASHSEVDVVFSGVVQNFHRERGRLSHPLLEGYFLRGVMLWTESLNDLSLARDIFRLTSDEIEIFMARIAYFSHHYDRSLNENPGYDARAGARAVLQRFDHALQGTFTRPAPPPFLYNPSTGRMTLTPTPLQMIRDLRDRLGINVSEQPVGGFHFNNNRYYDFLGRTSDEELWTAQQIAVSMPRETLIGLGDPSVRNFLRVFRFSPAGHLARFGKAADFLSVRSRLEVPGEYEFCLRELKHSKKENNIDVEKALVQLRNTAEDLNQRYPGISIAVVEIVVPQRGLRLNRRYFRTGNPRLGSGVVFELVDELGWPVNLRVGGRNISVTVRLIEPTP